MIFSLGAFMSQVPGVLGQVPMPGPPPCLCHDPVVFGHRLGCHG